MKHVKPGPGPLLLGPRGKRHRERREPRQTRSKKQQYSPDFKEQLVQEYLNGTDHWSVVAERHGVKPGTLKRWVEVHLNPEKARTTKRKPRRSAKYSKELKQEVLAAYIDSGDPARIVAERFGLPVGTVAHWVWRWGAAKTHPQQRRRRRSHASSSYRDALPKEQWPKAERFLQWLYWTKRQAQKESAKVDVNAWLKTVRDAGLIYRDPRDDEEIQVGCEDLVANVVAGGGD